MKYLKHFINRIVSVTTNHYDQDNNVEYNKGDHGVQGLVSQTSV